MTHHPVPLLANPATPRHHDSLSPRVYGKPLNAASTHRLPQAQRQHLNRLIFARSKQMRTAPHNAAAHWFSAASYTSRQRATQFDNNSFMQQARAAPLRGLCLSRESFFLSSSSARVCVQSSTAVRIYNFWPDSSGGGSGSSGSSR